MDKKTITPSARYLALDMCTQAEKKGASLYDDWKLEEVWIPDGKGAHHQGIESSELPSGLFKRSKETKQIKLEADGTVLPAHGYILNKDRLTPESIKEMTDSESLLLLLLAPPEFLAEHADVIEHRFAINARIALDSGCIDVLKAAKEYVQRGRNKS